MKKWIAMAAASLMLGCMCGCTATKTIETAAHVNVNPEGMTPEKVAATKEVVEKVGQIGAPTLEMEFFYYGNDDNSGLVQDFIDVEKIDAQDIVNKLIENDILDEGCKVLSFDAEGEVKAGPGVEASGSGERIGTLDLSSIPDLSEEKWEKIVIYAIGNSFIENYELDGLHLLVNGEVYSSEQFPFDEDTCLEYLEKYKKFQ